MELNLKKHKQIVLDFCNNVYKTTIPFFELSGHVFEKVTSYKLTGLLIDDDLKWKSNVKYMGKKSDQTLVFSKNSENL